jgi:hypothetical protein
MLPDDDTDRIARELAIGTYRGFLWEVLDMVVIGGWGRRSDGR